MDGASFSHSDGHLFRRDRHVVGPALMDGNADCPVRRDYAVVGYAKAYLIRLIAHTEYDGDQLIGKCAILRIIVGVEYDNPTPDHLCGRGRDAHLHRQPSALLHR